MLFSDATPDVIDRIEEEIERSFGGAPTLEAAAQALASLLFETFKETTVLARVFVTVPFIRLPASNQDFVRRLAGERGGGLLKAHTPILSLAGTRGRDPRWNSRHHSRGHAGIPLVSLEFVEEIPMIARLLKELAARFEWAGDLDTTIVTASLGNVAGVFYVEDAATELDERGRRVIAAQDFVRGHGVRTVFGFGGAYPVARTFVAVVVFTDEVIERRQAERFMRLANSFKAATLRPALEGRMFGAGAVPGEGSQTG